MNLEPDALEPEADILEQIPFSKIIRVLKQGPLLAAAGGDNKKRSTINAHPEVEETSEKAQGKKRVSLYNQFWNGE